MTKSNVTAASESSAINGNSFFHCVCYTLSIFIVLLITVSIAAADEPWRQLRPGEFFLHSDDGRSCNTNELAERMKGKKARIVDCRMNQPMTFYFNECGRTIAKTSNCGDIVGLSLRERLFDSTKTPGTNHLTLSCKQGEYIMLPVAPVGKKTWNPAVPKIGVIIAIE